MLARPALKRRSGFSLVELVTVIAVIGILIALIVPAVGGIQDGARKTQAANKLRQIAQSYQAYLQQTGGQKPILASDAYDFAAKLAETAELNVPDVWIVDEDPLVVAASGTRPAVVALPPSGEATTWMPAAEFEAYPLSFAVATRLNPAAPAATTPLAWTRGLATDGTWNAADATAHPGVYGEEGGHVVFLDGHVKFYPSLAEDGGQLQHYTTKARTANIQEAISPGAQAVDMGGSAY
ncbi:MAG: type II secretion system protein [Verrucomicrobiota bacterium JB022]|nr:type II secretion system protein [Verrucomicrobiota bacterium JB022]